MIKIKEEPIEYPQCLILGNCLDKNTANEDIYSLIREFNIDTDVHWAGISTHFCEYVRGVGHVPNKNAPWKLWPIIDIVANDIHNIQWEGFTKYTQGIYI